MSSKRDLQNCFLDLQRAAVSFYLNPKGESYWIFLNHAYKILKEKKRSAKFTKQIKTLMKRSAQAKKEDVINLADEMLTLGLLLKGG